VAAVIHHTLKNITKLRVAFRLAVPLGENHRRDFDISPQLVGRMAPQEQAVEKGCLALRRSCTTSDGTNCGIVAIEKMQFTQKLRRVK
jgi:hypothetical protein